MAWGLYIHGDKVSELPEPPSLEQIKVIFGDTATGGRVPSYESTQCVYAVYDDSQDTKVFLHYQNECKHIDRQDWSCPDPKSCKVEFHPGQESDTVCGCCGHLIQDARACMNCGRIIVRCTLPDHKHNIQTGRYYGLCRGWVHYYSDSMRCMTGNSNSFPAEPVIKTLECGHDDYRATGHCGYITCDNYFSNHVVMEKIPDVTQGSEDSFN